MATLPPPRLLLIRRIPIGGLAAWLSVAYVPKGPLMDWTNRILRVQVLTDLADIARRQGAIHLKIDPDVRLASGDAAQDGAPVHADPIGAEVESELSIAGWQQSHEQIQFRNTVILDLTAEEDAMLARMKQKTRYNIRLAGRKGVIVRPGTPADFDLLHRMYAETSLRDGFVIRDERYYRQLWNVFYEAGYLEPLIAEVENEPVAGILVFRFARSLLVYLWHVPSDTSKNDAKLFTAVGGDASWPRRGLRAV